MATFLYSAILGHTLTRSKNCIHETTMVNKKLLPFVKKLCYCVTRKHFLRSSFPFTQSKGETPMHSAVKCLLFFAILPLPFLAACTTGTIVGVEGNNSPFGSWENRGYSGILRFTNFTKITFSKNGELVIVEELRPREGVASSWIRDLIPEGNKKVTITYRGTWGVDPGGIIVMTLTQRTWRLDGRIVSGSDFPADHFWHTTNVQGSEVSRVHFEVLQRDRLLLLTFNGNRDEAPILGLHFSANGSLLMSRT